MQPEARRRKRKGDEGKSSSFPHPKLDMLVDMVAPGLATAEPSSAEGLRIQLHKQQLDSTSSDEASITGGGMIGDGGPVSPNFSPEASQAPTAQASLIPGLRDSSLALQCLARVPRASHAALKSVCRAWKKALTSREFYQLRQDLKLQDRWIYLPFCHRFPDFLPAPEAATSNGHANGTDNGLPGPSPPPWMKCVWLTAYDPHFNLWHPIGRFPGLRDSEILKGFGMVSIDERLYVIGGRLCTKYVQGATLREAAASHVETDLEVRKEVFSLDCTSGEWKQCASMATARVDFACTVAGGHIYVAGGRSHMGIEKGVASAEVYIPELDRWEPLPSMTTGRYKCVGVNSNHKIHVIGGFTGPEDSDTVNVFTIDRSSVDVFQPEQESSRWDVVKGMWQLDIPPRQIVSLEGKLYSSGDLLHLWKGSIETYDEELNMWKAVEGSRRRMREKLELQGGECCYLTMAVIGRKLYFVGGYRVPSQPPKFLDTIDIFDLDVHSAPTDVGKWDCMLPVQSPCKELCSHCCVVAL